MVMCVSCVVVTIHSDYACSSCVPVGVVDVGMIASICARWFRVATYENLCLDICQTILCIHIQIQRILWTPMKSMESYRILWIALIPLESNEIHWILWITVPYYYNLILAASLLCYSTILLHSTWHIWPWMGLSAPDWLHVNTFKTLRRLYRHCRPTGRMSSCKGFSENLVHRRPNGCMSNSTGVPAGPVAIPARPAACEVA